MDTVTCGVSCGMSCGVSCGVERDFPPFFSCLSCPVSWSVSWGVFCPVFPTPAPSCAGSRARNQVRLAGAVRRRQLARQRPRAGSRRAQGRGDRHPARARRLPLAHRARQLHHPQQRHRVRGHLLRHAGVAAVHRRRAFHQRRPPDPPLARAPGRLRAGGIGSAAGELRPLPPVLSRNPAGLPGERRHLRGGRARPTPALPQPPHRRGSPMPATTASGTSTAITRLAGCTSTTGWSGRAARICGPP